MRNKFLQGITSFAIASAVCMAFGTVTASAAPVASVEVDYQDMKLNVTGASGDTADRQIMVGIATYNAKTGFKTASWDVYDGSTASIDLSSLNTQKDNYLQIKGDTASDDEVTTLLIPASDKKVKMKFNPATGKVENNKGSAESVGSETKDGYTFEYRTQYGNWQPYGTYKDSEVVLSEYQNMGTTLYFRQAANAEKASSTDGFEALTIGEKAITNGFKAFPLPGKEIKVAVGKRANGPKAKIDYLKNIVTIPKNAEWRVLPESGEIGSIDFTEADSSSTTVLTEEDGLGALLGGGSLELKTAANEDKQKAASKVTHVGFKAQESTDGFTAEDTAAINEKTGVATPDGNIKATVEAKKDKKGKVTKYEVAVEFTGEDDDTTKYEVVVAKAQPTDLTKVKGAKAVTNKNKGTKLAKISVKKADVKEEPAEGEALTVWIHKAGDAKKGVWATDYTELGVINYVPDAVEESSETDAQKLKKIADALKSESYSAVWGSSGKVISTIGSVTLGAEAKYTKGGATLDGVKITATNVTPTTNIDKESDGTLKTKSTAPGTSGATATVTLLLKKGEAEESIDITLSLSKS